MKKKYIIVFVIILTAVVTLIRNMDFKHITFLFAESDIVQVEMYHYEGVPTAEECKIITGREDIEVLYKELQNIKVRDKKKESEPMTGGSVTRFVFVLSDGKEYDLEYYNPEGIPSLFSKAGNFEYQTSANLEKYWTNLDYELVEKEPEMLSIDEYNEKYAAKDESGKEDYLEDDSTSMSDAYKAALYRIRNTHTFPDGVNYGYDEFYDISENHFAIYDVDADGKNELLISYWTTSMAGNVFKIYGYDEISDDLQEEFSEYLGVTFYSNGMIEAKKSHNHGLASMSEEFWPYALYQYDSENDCYIKTADVDAWEQAYRSEYEGIEFPKEADIDGDGLLYYIMTNDTYEYQNPMDAEAYEKWRDSYLKDTEVIQIPLLRLTKENIENITDSSIKIEYSDEELIKMAYNYITEETSWNPEYYEVEFSADTFRIWLYDIISDEESSHGVTRGKFEINRKTGLGEDSITFEKIDFSKYK